MKKNSFVKNFAVSTTLCVFALNFNLRVFVFRLSVSNFFNCVRFFCFPFVISVILNTDPVLPFFESN